MKSEIWSIRDVPVETRQACAIRARMANQPIGQWITQAMQEYLSTIKAVIDIPAKKDDMSNTSDWITYLEMRVISLETRLDAMTTETSADVKSPAKTEDDYIANKFTEIMDRLNALESKTVCKGSTFLVEDVMVEIASLKAQGMLIPAIAKAMAGKGMMSPGGKPWTDDSLRGWLKRQGSR